MTTFVRPFVCIPRTYDYIRSSLRMYTSEETPESTAATAGTVAKRRMLLRLPLNSRALSCTEAVSRGGRQGAARDTIMSV